MPSMKNMKKQGYGGKAFQTNSKVPQSHPAKIQKGFQRGSKSHGVTAETMGVGGRPTGRGKAMGTAKGRGGKSY